VFGLGCGGPDFSRSEVVGVYDGSYVGCTETLNMREDQSFQQIIANNGVTYTNSGSWNIEIEGSRIAPQTKLVFRQFLVAVNTRDRTPLIPPKKYEFYTADWDKQGRIEFRMESQYFVVRKTSTN